MHRTKRSERRARVLAQKSDMNQNLAAIIIQGGKILGSGFNQRIDYNHSHHAEIKALKSMRRQKRTPKGADIHVYRFRADGTYGLAKPCRDCMIAIKEAGIKRVFYSDYDGSMKMLKVDDVNLDDYGYRNRRWKNTKNE